MCCISTDMRGRRAGEGGALAFEGKVGLRIGRNDNLTATACRDDIEFRLWAFIDIDIRNNEVVFVQRVRGFVEIAVDCDMAVAANIMPECEVVGVGEDT